MNKEQFEQLHLQGYNRIPVYRSVLADILEHRLATGNMAAVLPGYLDTPEKRLGFALPLGALP